MDRGAWWAMVRGATVSPWGRKELDTTEHTCKTERDSDDLLEAYTGLSSL